MQLRERPAPALTGATTRVTRPTLGVPLMSPVDLGSDIPYLRDDMSPLLASPAPTPSPGAEAHTPPLFYTGNTPSVSPTTQAPRLREVRSTPRLRSESPQPLPDVLERIRQRTAYHSQALYRARDDGRVTTPAHELPTPPVPEWHEGEGWRAPSLSPPLSAGLGLNFSPTTLHELHSPMLSELSLSEAEDRGTPDSAPAPWLGRHAEPGRPRPSLRRRISSSLLGGRRSRATPEPPSAGPSPSTPDVELMGRGPVTKRSNSNLRRLLRSADEDEARARPLRLRISPVVRPPTPVEKSPRMALQDLPEMPNPYATPVSAAPPVFEVAGGRQRQHLLNELASTEHTYASDLGIVQNVYLAHARRRAGLRPLPQGAASSLYSSIHTSPDMLPRSLSSLSFEDAPGTRRLPPPGGAAPAPPLSVTDMHVIFAGLGPCYALAMEMRGLLAAAASAQRTVSSVFLEKMGAIEQAYSLYCARHEAAVARLADVTTKNAAAASFLHECDEIARPYTSAWDLPSLLIKPVQRVLKYPLFLRSILEQTSSEDPEYAALQQALAQIQGVADRINESKKRMDVVGQHGFGPPAPRAAFRRPVAGGALRKAKSPTSEGPLTSDEGHYLALVARLDAAEQQLERLAQYCAAWTSSVRGMYSTELLVVLAWMAVYESGAHDRATLERLVQLRILVEHRLLGQTCEQLERSVERAVHAKVRAALQLVERPKMVVLNRSAKEAEYRKYLVERARRGGAAPSEGATAFLSMHMQLVDEIPTLLRGLDVVLQHCVLALSQVQAAFYGVVAEQFEQYCALYMPSAMTPTSASTVSSARFPDMPGSPAGTSSSLGPGTAPLGSQGEAYTLPGTPAKGLPPLGADISTMATTHDLLDEPLSTPHPPRSVYPDPNGPIERMPPSAYSPVRALSLEHATPRASLPVLDLSFDGYAQTPWNLGHASEMDFGTATRPSPHNSVFYDARSSLGDVHALRRPSQLL